MVISISATGRLLALVAALPLTNALGCYSGGLAFEDLHGGADSNDLDMEAEVLADISNVCNEVNGAVFKNGDPPFSHCSDWTVTVEPDDTCYDVCLLGGGLDCDPDCGGPVVGSVNHIDWQISYLNGAEEATMTLDICKGAFSTELGGCSTGSEQNHDGFWWKIDPNAGACPAAPDPTPAPPPSSDCEQPYYEYEDSVEGIYMVNFTETYTLQQHFDFLGETFDVTELSTGYYASLTDDQLAKVRSDCQVHFVEDDTFGPSPEEEGGVGDSGESAIARRGEQKAAPWPLFQISAATIRPLDESYYYVDNAGEGVDVYIFDSGINHPYDEFNTDGGSDRVIDEINVSTEPDDYSDIAANAGHGTMVASAVGGKGYGVAKSATLRNVKYERNGKPDAAGFVKAMQEVIVKHNARKAETGFKGSIINMSFVMTKTRLAAKELENAYNAGISLVAGAGNFAYNPNAFPATDEHVISVGASSNDYTPWQGVGEGSNYGNGVIDLWAPGQRVPLINRSGNVFYATGTSYATPYVSGILAIFYGVEGTSMTPDLARERLMAQTDDWITLPDTDGIDWHDSPKAFANTGNRKGAAQTPPVVYIGGPEV
ncbi:hypothetical protein LTR37_003153 [Vermiconidia calcicola]|uniref:Uncharacterized protein n=1 Tax=Vermiconidia calcicola TaxID=1690605 RepID=A0ACC3NQG1_9PEZI|nr:hypothetical protein LTR37_003153 [Vermiconidia calcicola]